MSITEFEEYRKMVIGRVLTNLFFTKQDGPYDYMPGISPAYYFWTVMELDNSTKLRFGNDYIVEWDGKEELIVLTNYNWELSEDIIFKNQKITNLIKDDYDQLIFHLENGITIIHTIDYGDALFIENQTNMQ
ncbi:hypothetical protein CLV94_2811 [Flavobacterium endophyticum]|uniref:Uncharacterized protein n=1 Tax=Flavobacterium endophyticum TaxID=1540163 RepID=A0A495M5F1_9FLAO|nr:hypothetical protein [Flavobacterium endophyticum]RKS20432.1 hypothetical protein CLV94_2811 [Flavobacterium endophyticum]